MPDPKDKQEQPEPQGPPEGRPVGQPDAETQDGPPPPADPDAVPHDPE